MNFQTVAIAWRVGEAAFALGGAVAAVAYLKAHLGGLESRIGKEIEAVRQDVRSQVESVRADVRAQVATVHDRINAIAAPAKATVSQIGRGL